MAIVYERIHRMRNGTYDTVYYETDAKSVLYTNANHESQEIITNVNEALDDLYDKVDTGGGVIHHTHTVSDITDIASNYASKTDTDNAKATLANAIVSKGGTATSSMTFAQLASAVEDLNGALNFRFPTSYTNTDNVNFIKTLPADTDVTINYSDYQLIFICKPGNDNAGIIFETKNKTGISFLHNYTAGSVFFTAPWDVELSYSSSGRISYKFNDNNLVLRSPNFDVSMEGRIFLIK